MLKSIILIISFAGVFSLTLDHDRCLALNLIHSNQDFKTWECGTCKYVEQPQNFRLVPEDNIKIDLVTGFYGKKAYLSFNFNMFFIQTFPNAALKSPTKYSIQKGQVLVQNYFLQTWNSVKAQTRQFLQLLSSIDKVDSLIITGNSIGGSIATLAAFQINQWNLFNQFQAVTFSPMMVGNDRWASMFNQELGHKYTHYDFDNCMASRYPIFYKNSVHEDIQFFHVGREFDCDMVQNICQEVQGSLQVEQETSYIKRNLRSINRGQVTSPLGISATNQNLYYVTTFTLPPIIPEKSFVISE